MTSSAFQEMGVKASRVSARAVFEARLEDFEFLLEVGSPPEEAAIRAGWPSRSAAARALHRHGHHELARPLEQDTYTYMQELI